MTRASWNEIKDRKLGRMTKAERAEYDADVGWAAIERATPQPFPAGPSPAYERREAGGAAGASSTSM